MFCPECGTDAADAKFCPECGAGLAGVRSAVDRGGARTTGSAARRSGAATGTPRKGGTSGSQGDGGTGASPGRRPQPSGTNPVVLWALIAVIAVAVVVAVVLTQRTDGADGDGAATGSVADAPAAVPSTAAPKLGQVTTKGSYQQLVAAGNAYYDNGAALQQSERFEEAIDWFAAAAKAYGAAWALKPGDPALGTDFATSIFYSATTAPRIQAAIDQVNKVIADNPGFQMARFNKGNYLAELARRYEADGKTAQAESLFAEARAEYEAAVEIDSGSPSGQAAAAALESL